MEPVPGYQIQSTISESEHAVVYRALGDGRRWILRYLKLPLPTPADAALIGQEFEIVKTLPAAGIVRPRDLIWTRTGLVIVTEETEGVTLAEDLASRGRMTLTEFLVQGLCLAETLAVIHDHRVIHGELSSERVLVNRRTGMVKIADLGMHAIHVHAGFRGAARSYEGNLSCIAPEQTGRITSTVDHRADLYALGIILYEAITGVLPFRATDPGEIIHAHIARRPVPPAAVVAGLPPVVSDVILKLLAKNPDERYQGARGLAADLAECRRRLEGGGELGYFTIAARDTTVHFVPPRTLHGRDAEIRVVMGAFDEATAGRAVAVLIMGPAGMGKTTFIEECTRLLQARTPWVATGNYEQLRHDVPYSGIAQAFQALVRRLLMESESRLAAWRENLTSRLGNNARLVADLVPDLLPLLDDVALVEELGPEESRNRFHHVMRQFIAAFALPGSPLVLVLDNLQWADLASRDLLTALAADPLVQNLLVIGAIRPLAEGGVIAGADPAAELRKRGARVKSVELAPLTISAVAGLVEAYCHCGDRAALELARVIEEKTMGIPFFIIQFIKALHDRGMLAPDGQSGWEGAAARLRALPATLNVVHMLIERIANLPDGAMDLLKISACIGSAIEVDALASLAGVRQDEAALTMNALVVVGILGHREGGRYDFSHDSIREAVYGRIDVTDRSMWHHRIGRRILDLTPLPENADSLFPAVNHLNRGSEHLGAPEERRALARLNLMAGRRARRSSAFRTAEAYFRTGMELLDGASWENEYQLTYDLYLERTECGYFNGHFDLAERLFRDIIERARSPVEAARAYGVMIVQYTNMGRLAEAIGLGIDALRRFGISVPQNPSRLRIAREFLRLRLRLLGRRVEDLADLPAMSDPRHLAVVQLIQRVGTPAIYVNMNLAALLIFMLVNMHLRHGNSTEAASGFLALGNVFSSWLGDIDRGYRLGRLALELCTRYPSRINQCMVEFGFAWFLQHTREHLKQCLAYYRESYNHAMESGTQIYAGHSLNLMFFMRMILGENLGALLTEMEKAEPVVRGIRDPFIYENFVDNRHLIANLHGLTENELSFNMEGYDEEKRIASIRESKNLLYRFNFLYNKTISSYIHGAYGLAQRWLAEMNKIADIARGAFHYSDRYFYHGMVMASLYPALSFRERLRARRIIAHARRQMATLSKHCPENHRHKELLLGAELYRLRGDDRRAGRAYHDAITSARENSFIVVEAIASERAARHYRAGGYDDIARMYMTAAHEAYRRLGARFKTRLLERDHPDLIVPRFHTGGADGAEFSVTADSLDLAAILKASGAIAEEIRIDRLLSVMMTIILENAGARYGCLVLERDGVLSIEARADLDDPAGPAVTSEPLDASRAAPRSVIHYAARTGAEVIMTDAGQDYTFAGDPYVMSRRPRSVLCMPLVNQGRTSAVLYLENNLTAGAFTPERLQVLRSLSAQMAIAIENARLYAGLEDKVAGRTRDLRLAMDEMDAINNRLTAANRELEDAQVEAARDLQMAMYIQSNYLPRTAPETDEWDIAFRYLPMHGISGDFYDFYKDDAGRFRGVSLFDVSGHGISSGLITMIAKSIIYRRYVTLLEHPLDDVMKCVNDDLVDEIAAMYAYLTGVLFRFSGSEVEYVNAAHPDILCYRAAGNVVECLPGDDEDLRCSVLGVRVENMTYAMNRFSVSPGDVFLLYSDGLIEGKNRGEEFYGMDRLVSTFTAVAKGSPGEILAAIMEDYARFLGGTGLQDDCTIIVLKRLTV